MSRFIAGCRISLWRLCAGIGHRLPYVTRQDSSNKNTSEGKDIYILEVFSELESGYRMRWYSGFASGAMLKIAQLATGCLH